MTELFLDGQLAIPSQNTSIKLTSENIYFTKTSSYTYDVELPFAIPENKKIFGDINRLDVSKQSRTLSASLIVDNIPVLIGTAHIISLTEKSVKVQLLGEAASYNYGNKMEDTFIDQIDLGDWYWETWPDGSYRQTRVGIDGTRKWLYYKEGTRISYAGAVLSRAYYKGIDYGDEKFSEEEMQSKFLRGDFGWVAYPTYNTSADIRHNAIAWKETAQGSRVYNRFLRQYEGERCGERKYPDREPVVASFAIQPFVWKMAEIIAKATGFVLERNNNALYNDSFFKQIFIVNTSTSALCNKCLPHWSVNEWWEQLENTFGVVISIDYAKKSMSIERRAEHYINAKTSVLRNVVDQYETTLDDETQTDISVNNVGYADFDANPEDLLAEEIMNSAEFMDFESSADLLTWCNDNASNLRSYKGTIFRCKDGRQYIYSTNVHGSEGIIEVNMFRPRIVNQDDDDIDIELKIVPARFSTQKADLYATWTRQPGAAVTHRDKPDGTFDVLMLEVPGVEPPELDDDNSETMDIQAILEGDENAERNNTEQPDLLYIAIINPLNEDNYDETITLESGGTTTHNFKYPRGRLRERAYAPLKGTISFEDSGQSLSLIPIAGQRNLAAATITNLVTIKTIVRYCIKFISGTIPNPGAIFNIRNRLFVCEKIEANIKPNGLDKLLTGYFYEYDS